MKRTSRIAVYAVATVVVAVAPIPSYLLWQKAELWAREERKKREAAAEAALAKLANLHDLEALDAALSHRTTSRGRHIIAYGFACPEGREHLLKKITDPDVATEQRLRHVRLLSTGGPAYYSVFHNIERGGASMQIVAGQGNGRFLERVARAAVSCREDEVLCLALLDELGHLARGAGMHSPESVLADRVAAVAPLRTLHAAASDRIKFKVEDATSELDRAGYDSLPPKCGPILSELRPCDPKHYGHPSGRALKYEYTVKFLDDEPLVAPELVAVSPTTEEEFVLASQPLSFRSRGEAGMRTMPIPDDVPPGRYRIFCRFSRDGKVLSEGYGFETEL